MKPFFSAISYWPSYNSSFSYFGTKPPNYSPTITVFKAWQDFALLSPQRDLSSAAWRQSGEEISRFRLWLWQFNPLFLTLSLALGKVFCIQTRPRNRHLYPYYNEQHTLPQGFRTTGLLPSRSCLVFGVVSSWWSCALYICHRQGKDPVQEKPPSLAHLI